MCFEKIRCMSNNYESNKGQLIQTPFIELPLGTVKAKSWLKNQLVMQRDGFTDHMESFPDYGANSSWKGGEGESWERGPYYLRGLVALAYTLDDEKLKAKAQVWIDHMLDSQTEEGNFGPIVENWDWWPRMVMLMAIRDHYEANKARGIIDERVIPFMEKYLRFQLSNLKDKPLVRWAQSRGGDNMDSVYWLYNRIYDESAPKKSEWLLELGNLLNEQTIDKDANRNWTDLYNNSTVRVHVVNTSQGMKTPPVRYQYTKSDEDRSAIFNGAINWGIDHGRQDGLPNSDEAARDNRSTRGTETCGIVESLLSLEIGTKILGDVELADRIERIAYNALPVSFAPDYSGHVYYIEQNVAIISQGIREYVNDHGDSITFGAPSGYDCCFSNAHMGWPKFVQNMWMATNNNGLAVITYGPNEVVAKVSNGQTAIFKQTTDYPFKDYAVFTYEGDEAAFELKLRIPEWANGTVVELNGHVLTGVKEGEYYTIDRAWQKNDHVRVQFNPEIKIQSGYNDSVSISRGSLIFGLKIGEDWRINNDNTTRELKVEAHEELPTQEVFPTTPWNYGLLLNQEEIASNFVCEREETVHAQPFQYNQEPLRLKCKGQLIPEWTLDGNIVGPQPFGAVEADKSKQADIELVPYACSRLRITEMPRIGENTQGVIVKTSAKDATIVCDAVNRNKKLLDFNKIVVPKAEEYRVDVQAIGTGKLLVKINNQLDLQVDINNGATIDNLKSLISDEYFMFTHGHFNSLKFPIVDDIEIESIKVTPINRSITDVHAQGKRAITTALISTNLDPQETPFRVLYGIKQDNLNSTVKANATNNLILEDLDADVETYYAKVITLIDGQQVESDVLTLEKQEQVNSALMPNANAMDANARENFMADYWANSWTGYGQKDKMGIVGGKYTFQAHGEMKSIYNSKDALKWTDYVFEIDITLLDSLKNDAGMLIRASQITDKENGYNGYYIGLGQSGVIIGEVHQKKWNVMDIISFEIIPNQQYKLKAVVFKDMFAVYVDDVLMYKAITSVHGNGTIGLRGFEQSFAIDELIVRNIEQKDLSVFEDFVEPHTENSNEDLMIKELKNIEIESFYGGFQVYFPKFASGKTYSIHYGTESETYENVYQNVTANVYRPHKMEAEKISVSGLDLDTTYYVVVKAISGNEVVAQSKELVVNV